MNRLFPYRERCCSVHPFPREGGRRSAILYGTAVMTACCFLCNGTGQKNVGRIHAMKNETYKQARMDMVNRQIRARGIHDERVLRAMQKVRRHCFVPPDYRHAAYADEPLPIGHQQTISQPYIVAYMTQALSLKGDEKVLEIGTGSGYQAAVLAELAHEVYSIEIVGPLAAEAVRTLNAEGYDSIHVRHGDGYLGWPEAAPFDAIIVTAAPPRIPEKLIGQLVPGGRMIVPVGDYYQELVLVEKEDGQIRQSTLLPVRFVPMTGKIQDND